MTESPRSSVLDNGITLVTQRVPGSRQAVVQLSVDVGAKDEGKNKAGLSHFLEHMLASDNERQTAEEAAERLLEMRGTSDAFTTYDSTDYTYYVGNQHAEEAVQMLADSVLRAKIDPERLDKERASIKQEHHIMDEEGDEELQTRDLGLQIAFPDSDLDKSIDGTFKQLNKRTREDLLAFRDQHYTGDRMVLTVVGDVDHDTLKAQAEQHFAGLPKEGAHPRKKQKPLHYRGGMYADFEEGIENSTLSLSFEGSGERDARGIMLDAVLVTALDEGFSSRLFKSLRNDTGISYAPSCYSEHFRNSGLFTIQTDTPAERAGEALTILCKELKDLPDTFSETELRQVKAALIGGMERQEQDLKTVTDRLSDAARTGQPIATLDEQIDLLESLTLKEVQDYARKMFTSPPTIVATANPDYPILPYRQITALLGHERRTDMSGLLKLEEKGPCADRSLRGAEVTAQPAAQRQVSR